jgi:hypothetical protein
MSFDVRLRLTTSEFCKLQLTHLYSDVELPQRSAAQESLLHGFTEWTAPSTRRLSFGWDWTFNRTLALFHADWESLRTNIVLLDAAGHEMGPTGTRRCVAERMVGSHWDWSVAEALGEKLRAGR